MGCRTAGTAVREDEAAPAGGPVRPVDGDGGPGAREAQRRGAVRRRHLGLRAPNDFAQAARYFGRLVDFHPDSTHRRDGALQRGARARAAEAVGGGLPALLRAGRRGEGHGRRAGRGVPRGRDAVPPGALRRRGEGARHASPAGRTSRSTSASRRGCSRASASWRPATRSRPRRRCARRSATTRRCRTRTRWRTTSPPRRSSSSGRSTGCTTRTVKLDPDKGTDELAEGPRVQGRAAAVGAGPLPARHPHGQRLLGHGRRARRSAACTRTSTTTWCNSPAPTELNAEEAEVYRAGAAQEDPRAAHQGDHHLRAHAGGGRAHRLAERLRGPDAREPAAR